MIEEKTAKVKIQKLELAAVNNSTYNPRVDLQEGDPRYKSIARSLNHFGLVDPLVVNIHNMVLVSGHQRAKILKANGYTHAEFSIVNLADEKEEMALNHALNKISGDWDYAMLAETLPMMDEDMRSLAGFEADEVARLLGKGDNDKIDDENTDVTEQVGSFKGIKCPRCAFEFEVKDIGLDDAEQSS